MNVFIIGGGGHLDPHTAINFIEHSFNIMILDNLSNSKLGVMNRVESITGIRPKFICGDVRDRLCLQGIFAKNKIDAVIHFQI